MLNTNYKSFSVYTTVHSHSQCHVYNYFSSILLKPYIVFCGNSVNQINVTDGTTPPEKSDTCGLMLGNPGRDLFMICM